MPVAVLDDPERWHQRAALGGILGDDGFKTRQVVYGALPQNRDAYANNFFSWVHDFNGDGFTDFTKAFNDGGLASIDVHISN